MPCGRQRARAVVEFIRDSWCGRTSADKWVNTWTPLLLTFFVFILRRERHRADSDLRCAGALSISTCCTRPRIRSSSASCTAARRRPATST